MNPLLTQLDPELGRLLGGGVRATRRPPQPESDRPEFTDEDERSILGHLRDKSIGALAATGNLIDLPGSVIRDAATWLPGGPKPANPLDQLLPWNWTSPEGRTSSRDLARGYGLASNKDTWGNFAAGLAGDIALDPLTYLTFGGSALSKVGQAAKKLGLMDDLAKVAARKGTVPYALSGGRQRQLTTTLADFVEHGDDVARTKAQGLIDAGHAADEPLGGLFGVGLPFQEPIKAWGTGSRSVKFAKALDDAGKAIRYRTIPGTNLAPLDATARLFDKTINGATEPFQQQVERDLFRAKEKALVQPRDIAGRQMQTLMAHGLTEPEHADLLKVMQEGFTPYDTPGLAHLIPAWQKLGQNPEAFDALQGVADELHMQGRHILAQPGHKTKALTDDFIGENYGPRYNTHEGGNISEIEAKRSHSATDPSTKARLDWTRNVPGGTAAVRQIVRDPELKKLLREGAPTVEGIEAYLKTKHEPWLSDTYKSWEKTPVISEVTGKVLKKQQKAWVEKPGRYKAMAEYLANQSDETLGHGIYGNHPVRDMEARFLSHRDAEAAKHSFIDAITQPGVLADRTRKLGEKPADFIELGQLANGLNYKVPGEAGILKLIQDRLGGDYAGKSLQEIGKLKVKTSVADGLSRMVKGSQSPEAWHQILDVVDSATNLAKGAWTSPWPAFHVRNFTSGQLWNAIKGTWSKDSLRSAMALHRGQTIAGLGKKEWILREMKRDHDSEQAIREGRPVPGAMGNSQSLDSGSAQPSFTLEDGKEWKQFEKEMKSKYGRDWKEVNLPDDELNRYLRIASPESSVSAQPVIKAGSKQTTDVQSRVVEAYRTLSGGQSNKRVQIADLHAALPEVPLAQLHDELKKISKNGWAILSQNDLPSSITDADRASQLVNALGHPRHVVHMNLEAIKPQSPSFTLADKATPSGARSFDNAFDTADIKSGNRNYVKVSELRSAMSHLNREQFDAELKKLRIDGKYGMDSAHGGHSTSLTKEELESGIKEGNSTLLYVSRKPDYTPPKSATLPVESPPLNRAVDKVAPVAKVTKPQKRASNIVYTTNDLTDLGRGVRTEAWSEGKLVGTIEHSADGNFLPVLKSGKSLAPVDSLDAAKHLLEQESKGQPLYTLADDGTKSIPQTTPDNMAEVVNKATDDWSPEDLAKIADHKTFSEIGEQHAKFSDQLEQLVKQKGLTADDAKILRLTFSQSELKYLPESVHAGENLKNQAGEEFPQALGFAEHHVDGVQGSRIALAVEKTKNGAWIPGAAQTGTRVMLHELGHIVWNESQRVGADAHKQLVKEFKSLTGKKQARHFIDEFTSGGDGLSQATHHAGVGPRSGKDPTSEQFAEFFATSIMRRKIPQGAMGDFIGKAMDWLRNRINQIRSAVGLEPSLKKRLDEIVDELGGFNAAPDLSSVRGKANAPVESTPPAKPPRTAERVPWKEPTDAEAAAWLHRKIRSLGLVGKHESQVGTISGRAGEGFHSGTIQSMAQEMGGEGIKQTDMLRVARKAIGRHEGTTLNLRRAKMRGVGGAEESTLGPFKAGEELGHGVEYMNRVAPWLKLAEQGVDLHEAAKRVSVDQIQYGGKHYTDFERNVMSRLFPFFKFSKGIGPQVAKELTEHPGGRLAQVIRAKSNSQDQSGVTPDYVRETASIPLGNLLGQVPEGTDRYLTGLGMMHEDPFGFGPGIKGAMLEGASRLNPFLKAPLELMSGQSFFQKGPDGGRKLDDLDPLLGRIAANVGLTEEAKGFMPQWLEQIVANSPAARGLSTVRQLTDERKAFGKGEVTKHIPGVSSLLNTLTGVRITDVSPGSKDAIVRELLNREMKDSGAGTFERIHFRKDDKAKMSDDERLHADKLQALADILVKRAKARKAAKEAKKLGYD